MKNNRIITSILFFIGFIINAYSAPRSKQAILLAAKRALKVNTYNGSSLQAKGFKQLKVVKQNKAFTIVAASTGGYVIISNDDLLPEIIGYSETSFKENNINPNFNWFLNRAEQTIKEVVKKGEQLTTVKPDLNKYPQKVEGFVTTHWGQQDPFNRLCPTAAKLGNTPGQDYKGGDIAVTGCVATAMAQILRYNKYPNKGVGTKTLKVKQKDGTLKTFTVDFSKSVYKWNSMKDVYKKGTFNEEEATAVATLMRDCGFAANMTYGSDVSGTPITAAFEGLKTYFAYPETMKLLSRSDYFKKDIEWMNIVFKELSSHRAIFYGATDKRPQNGGHAFVLCGYNEEGKVYVNWGWNGDDNGYFDINLLNPINYQFSESQNMIIGLAPDRPARDKKLTVNINDAGTLKNKIDVAQLETLQTLKVTGKINSTDLKYLRYLGGVDAEGKTTDGAIEEIDLSEAVIEEGGEPYLIEADKQFTTKNNVLTQRAFYGCKGLKKIVLPKAITHIEDGAFGKLDRINELIIPQGDDKDYILENNILYSKDKTEIIEILPLSTGNIKIPNGVKKIHNYGFAGCQRITNISLPASIEFIGNNAFDGCYAYNSVRIYSKVPCKLGNNVFSDINKSITKLYVPFHTENVYKKAEQWKDFYNVFDNIIPFGSDIYVRTATREYGDDNPKFGYKVLGDDFVGEPILSCKATKTSVAGEYPINIEQGTIQSDMLQLFAGTLVVTKAKATLTVDSKSINLGDKFEPTFKISNLKNGETNCELVTQPSFIIKNSEGKIVTAIAKEGVYTVYPQNAEAQNYDFNYVAGTIKVYKDADSIEQVVYNSASKEHYYTLNGLIVEKPIKGRVYIYQGRKVIVR